MKMLNCKDAECPSNAKDCWKPVIRLWECSKGKRTVITCTDHAVPLEEAGWTCEKILTIEDLIGQEGWEGVGDN